MIGTYLCKIESAFSLFARRGNTGNERLQRGMLASFNFLHQLIGKFNELQKQQLKTKSPMRVSKDD